MQNLIPKSRMLFSYLYLLTGFVCHFFFNGKWIVPAAAFITPILFIRFLRFQRPLRGFISLILVIGISNIFVWRDMLPVSGFFYYILMFMMALFTSLTFFLDRIYTETFKGFISTVVFPSAFVLMEFIVVSTNPSGSYGTMAHTQSSLSILQLVSITGIWGITFFIMWSASVVNWLWDNSFERECIKKALLMYGIPFLIILLYGQVRLLSTNGTPTVRIAALNSTKEEYAYRRTANFDSSIIKANDKFLKNCRTAAASGAKIVFGRETIISLPYDHENEFIEKAKSVAAADSIYIGLPMQIIPKGYPGVRPENKIIWISPQGTILSTYYKARPTPGEGSYGDGKVRSFDSPFGRIASTICFDMDFTTLINQTGDMNIDIMLVPGNDWQEITPYHTYVASMRAIEHGFNLVRSVSGGFSASFDYKGRLLSSSDFFTTDQVILYSDVPIHGNKTMYSSFGDYFAWFCILFSASVSIIFVRKKLSH